MKLYKTVSHLVSADPECEGAYITDHFAEFTSSAGDASKVRTRLKKAEHEGIKTEEVDVPTTRAELIKFLNSMTAHESWVAPLVTEKLGG